MSGVLASAFDNRADAFQQLVGDGLLAMSEHFARSYPTKGEDGSIDGFLEANAPLAGLFEGLPLPLIVECKDHDDTLPRVAENILSAWSKVQIKLRKQAEEGWPDLFQPWTRTKTYVYAVSAVLPSQEFRGILETKIRGFFSGLPAAQRPLVERVVVADWNDLRLWLDRFPGVRDSWLGTGAQGILTLAQYRAGLTGFRKLLEAEYLPFSPPEQDSPHNPAIIFRDLSDLAEPHGILLVGHGGVGKTRTSYEVALLAEQANWRVIYVLPIDPPVTTEQLAATVLAQRSISTLVIIEYLDQMPHLDIGALRRSLVPKAREAGIHLALLANSRPGFALKKVHAERDFLFRRVDLTLSVDESRGLSHWAVEQTAPMSCAMLSKEEVFRICGSRPIIALLVAQQLERLAEKGELTLQIVRLYRTEDPLGIWLRKRLSEDKLTIPDPTSLWDTPKPPPEVVAAAAVLAAAPDERSGLVAAADSAIKRLGAAISGEIIVRGLRELGWLETDGAWLGTVHDVVADEIVEQAVFADVMVRKPEFEAVLSVALERARSFGRLTKAFTRLQGAVEEEQRMALEEASNKWLERHADVIGPMLSGEAATHGSYALGAVFGGSIFEKEAMSQWERLIGPWLERYDTDFEGRHLLYRGLRFGTEEVIGSLVDVAMRWLTRWRLDKAASFVMTWLLKQRTLSPGDLQQLIAWSLSWLKVHGKSAEAQFVLGPLLNRRDADINVLLPLALAWFEVHGESAEARFVLGPLLNRREADSNVLLPLALGWFEVHGTSAEAPFVLGPLLNRRDADINVLLPLALAWFEVHGKSAEAPFVLGPLLNRREADINVLLPLALAWFEVHGKSAEAQFVLGPLLNRREADSNVLLPLALAWFEVHGKSAEAGFVLDPLLNRREADSNVLLPLALAWFEVHGESAEARFVLDPLLNRREADSNVLLPLALGWFEVHGKSAEAPFVLGPLLNRRDADINVLLPLALAWFEVHGKSAEAQFVLGPLLNRRYADINVLLPLALAWFEVHGESAEARFVLGPLLKRGEVDSNVLLPLAFAWLELYEEMKEASHILDPCMKKGADKERIRHHLTRWLRCYGSHFEASFPLVSWLRVYCDPASIQLQVGLWLKSRKSEDDVFFLLVAWLKAGGDTQFVATHVQSHLKRIRNPRNFQTLSQLWEQRTRSSGR